MSTTTLRLSDTLPTTISNLIGWHIIKNYKYWIFITSSWNG